jgi:hypothetical protein
MDASTCHLGFTFSVIAVVAHILCVVLLFQMMAQKHFFFSLG